MAITSPQCTIADSTAGRTRLNFGRIPQVAISLRYYLMVPLWVQSLEAADTPPPAYRSAPAIYGTLMIV